MTQSIYSVKRKPEYYAAVLQHHDVADLKEFVLDEFDPDNNMCLTIDGNDILHYVHSRLVGEINTMAHDEVVDWCNVSYLAKQRKIIDYKNPEQLMSSIANPNSFSDN